MQNKAQYKVYNTLSKLGGRSLFSSVEKQQKRIEERRSKSDYSLELRGFNLIICRGVYRTGIDTELMIDVLSKVKGNLFLEVGCGCGAIGISAASRFRSGLLVDINNLAVNNSLINCKLNDVDNFKVLRSDVFSRVTGKFDVIVCNPPYNQHNASDDIEKMFWDTRNQMKENFFNEINKHLEPEGAIYFGWADFADLDFTYPSRMAARFGLKIDRIFARPSTDSTFRFLVFRFIRV